MVLRQRSGQWTELSSPRVCGNFDKLFATHVYLREALDSAHQKALCRVLPLCRVLLRLVNLIVALYLRAVSAGEEAAMRRQFSPLMPVFIRDVSSLPDNETAQADFESIKVIKTFTSQAV